MMKGCLLLISFCSLGILSVSPQSSDQFVEYRFIEDDLIDSPMITDNLRSQKSNRSSVRSEKNDVVRLLDITNQWFLKIPALPFVFATSATLRDGECKRQTRKYLRELQHGTLWAVKMFDSSVKYPVGVVSGTTRHYGNFDECYHLKATIPGLGDEVEEISSRYCLVEVEYRNMNGSHERSGPYSLDFDENKSAWEVIDVRHDWRQIRKDMLQLALCVPSSCSPEDVEEALQEPLSIMGQKNGISIKTIVKPTLCQSKLDEPEVTTSAKIFGCILLLLASLVLLGTYNDTQSNDQNNDDFITNLLLCFSLKKNMKSFLTISYVHPGLDTLHFLRTLFMFVIICAHRYFQFYENPVINAADLERSYTIPAYVILYNGSIMIDTFFAIGSMLVMYYLLAELDKRKKINFLGAVIMRHSRLTPSYIVVIAFTALFLPHLGSGPLWQHRVANETIACGRYWWTNLLYVNNYIHVDNQCLLQSWYLAVDFQLFILALFAVYIVWKLPRKLGYVFLGTIVAFGLIVRFRWVYYRNAQPIVKLTAHLHQVRDNHNFIDYYIRTEGRIASYFVGLIFGAILHDYDRSPWKISKFWTHVLLIASLAVTVFTWKSGFRYLDPNYNSSLFSAAMYGSLHRTVCTICLLLIVLLFTVGEGLESYRKFVTMPWLQPLAKLSYGVYLVSYTKQLYDFGVARQPRTFSILNLIWDFIPDSVLSLFLALVLLLIIEMPFRRIEKLLISRSRSAKKNALRYTPKINGKQEKIQ